MDATATPAPAAPLLGLRGLRCFLAAASLPSCPKLLAKLVQRAPLLLLPLAQLPHGSVLARPARLSYPSDLLDDLKPQRVPLLLAVPASPPQCPSLPI